MKRKPPAKGLLAGIVGFVDGVAQVADEATRAVEAVSAKTSVALEHVVDAKQTIEAKLGELRDVGAAAADTLAKARKLAETPPKRVKITRTP